MSWAKLDDGMWSHPKFLDLSNGAVGVWSKALSWSAQHLSDGAIPRALKAMLRATDDEVADLVRAELWDETDSGWQIHDYLVFNPSRESVLGERDKGKVRAQKSYERRKELKESSGEETKIFASSSGDPSRPVPSRPVPEELKSETHAPARFEKPPVGEAPPNTHPSNPSPIRPEFRCWQLYQRALGTEHLLLAMNHHDALLALASAARAEADGASHGEAFDRAAERILGVWMAEKYWKEKRPGLRNLKERLEEGKYARAAKPKPPVPARLSDRSLSDAELLAIDEFEEGELDVWQKQRRWELQARRDSADSRKLRSIVGGAS